MGAAFLWGPAGAAGTPPRRQAPGAGAQGAPYPPTEPSAGGQGPPPTHICPSRPAGERQGPGPPPRPQPSVVPGLRRRPSRAGSARAVPGLGLVWCHSGNLLSDSPRGLSLPGCGSGWRNEAHPCAPARPESTAPLSRPGCGAERVVWVYFLPDELLLRVRQGFRCGGLCFVQEWLEPQAVDYPQAGAIRWCVGTARSTALVQSRARASLHPGAARVPSLVLMTKLKKWILWKSG